jgi:glycine betaine catabolism A
MHNRHSNSPATNSAAERFVGVFGLPFIDLMEPLGGAAFERELDAVQAELAANLPNASTRYTGGTLHAMGVCAPWEDRMEARDASDAVARLSRTEFEQFWHSGGGDPAALATLQGVPARVGDETNFPLSQSHMLALERDHNVYFPWKRCYFFMEDHAWDDKHARGNKTWNSTARELFPRTMCLLEELPFDEIGRAVAFGMDAGDSAPFHRDSVPGAALGIAQSITLYPDSGKQLTLASPNGLVRQAVNARAYWFNDMDWHGVASAPTFRYSLRIDGRFAPAFLRQIEHQARRRR